jgi:nicotinamidase-related amidase
MKRLSFKFTTEQLELLLAFEEARGLADLSEILHKDPSVVSRNLQRLSEIAPVIVKENRKWQITKLGNELNKESKKFSIAVQDLLNAEPLPPNNVFDTNDMTLILINTQKVLEDSPHNTDVVENIKKILNRWRQEKRPVIHVRHISNNPESLFFSKSNSADFIESLKPTDDEATFEKEKASVLSSLKVQEFLNTKNFPKTLLVGFTGSDCIEASARSLSEQGFETFVVTDASASLDIIGPDGGLHKAERVHKLAMANIHAYSAKVIKTEEIFHLQK